MDMKCKNEAQLISICNWIKRQFHTGSRVIGGATDESDYDYVATLESASEFCSLIGLETLTEKEAATYVDLRFMSFKYRTSEQSPWLNLIVVMDDIDLQAWKYATETCKEWVWAGKNLWATKGARCQLFEACMNEYYMSVGCPERIIKKENK